MFVHFTSDDVRHVTRVLPVRDVTELVKWINIDSLRIGRAVESRKGEIESVCLREKKRELGRIIRELQLEREKGE